MTYKAVTYALGKDARKRIRAALGETKEIFTYNELADTIGECINNKALMIVSSNSQHQLEHFHLWFSKIPHLIYEEQSIKAKPELYDSNGLLGVVRKTVKETQETADEDKQHEYELTVNDGKTTLQDLAIDLFSSRPPSEVESFREAAISPARFQ